MVYKVELSHAATIDITDAVVFISRDSPHHAREWFAGIMRATEGLRQSPSRCPLVPEAPKIGRELRFYLYQSHRIIFEIDRQRKIVFVARVYHSSRRPLRRIDVPPIP